MTHTIKGALLGATLFLAPAAFAADIGGNEVSVSIGTDYVTEYVFRGVSLADDAIQPYAEASIGNFTAGIWASTGIGENSELAGDEIDLYASYGFDLSDVVSASVGVTYYHYPQGGSLFGTDNGGTGSYEFNAGVGFDTVLAPSATVYYDVTLEALTLEGGIGHSFTMSDRTSLDLGLTAGLVDADGGGDYEYGNASAGVSFALTDDAALSVTANYTLNSADDVLGFSGGTDPLGNRFAFTDRDNLFWGGIGISTSF